MNPILSEQREMVEIVDVAMMLNSDAKSFICPVCNKYFKSTGSLKTHLLIHSGEKLHECNLCSKRFTQKCTLLKHELTHTGERSFKCSDCPRSFSTKERLTEHYYVHLDLQLECNLCFKTFCSKQKLARHRALHSTEKPYKCNLCDSAFVCANYLSGHKRKVHNVKNIIYRCDICQKLCKSKRAFDCHKKSHRNERPYVCHLCPSTYKHSTNLKLHLLQHECAKPFICNVCLKAFSSPATLYQHNFIHIGKKNFQCEKCGKHFQRQHHLARHGVSHSGEKRYSCKYCDKKFKYKNGLKVHTRTHTGARPYTCDLCGWSFSQKSRMRSHRLTHTGEKPFKCVACGKAFCRHDKLTDHCRRMHKQLNTADLSQHVTKAEVEQDSGICDTGNSSFYETSDHLTDYVVPKPVSNSDAIIGTKVENGNDGSAADAFVTRNSGSNAEPAFEDFKICSAIGSTNGADDRSTTSEHRCTRSGRNYGRNAVNSENVKFSISEQTLSLNVDNLARSGSYNGIFQEKVKHKDLTEIVEIIDITPIDSVKESNFATDRISYKVENYGSNSVYNSDENESIEECGSLVANADEDSDTEVDEDRLESAAENESFKFKDSQNPDEIICVLPNNCSVQNDDEDFLFAMRIFGLLKMLPSDHEKSSLKDKIEQVLTHDNDT